MNRYNIYACVATNSYRRSLHHGIHFRLKASLKYGQLPLGLYFNGHDHLLDHETCPEI